MIRDIFLALDGDYNIYNSPVAKKLTTELDVFQQKNDLDNLYTTDTKLYQRLAMFVSRNDISIGDFMDEKGFDYRNPMRDVPAIKEMLIDAIETHGDLESLNRVDTELYRRISNKAHALGMGVKDFIHSLGLEYQGRLETDDEYYIQKVNDIIAEHGTLNGLWKHDYTLYNTLTSRAGSNNITLQEYLTKLGFEYDNNQTSVDEFIASLSDYANDDGIIDPDSLSDDSKWRLKNHATKENLTPQEFLLKNTSYKLAGEQRVQGDYIQRTQELFDEVFRPNGETFEIDLAGMNLGVTHKH